MFARNTLRRRSTRAAHALLFASLVASAGAAVGERSEGDAARTPVILVPGVTGTELWPAGGAGIESRPAWGVGRNLLLPRDGGYRLARSVVSGESDLEVGDVIERIRLLGIFRSDVYGPIVDRFVEAGYSRGDPLRPQPEDSLFLFPYDWRDDNVTSAEHLLETIERIRASRGVERLDVDLICQSGGAHICRYLAKYGASNLDRAERGEAGPPPSFRVARMVFVGTSNGGSLRILREMIRGRSYIPLVGRRWRPEVLFTFPGLFQDLPDDDPADGLFVDREGRSLSVDLYDPESWRRFGWSGLDPKRERRMSRAPDLFATPAERTEYLARVLDRARRFRALLARDVGFDAVCRLHMIQGIEEPTPTRAVLEPRRGGWKAYFTQDRFLRRRTELDEQVSEEGDGHASLSSQHALSPSERAKLASAPRHVPGSHFRMILEPETLEQLVTYLEPGVAEACGGP